MSSGNLVPSGSQFLLPASPPPFTPPLIIPKIPGRQSPLVPRAAASPSTPSSPAELPKATASRSEPSLESDDDIVHHVQLSGPLCQFSLPSDANILIDHGNRQLVAFYQRQICRYPYDTKRIKRPSNIRFESVEYDCCTCGRFSPDQLFIAAQIGPSSIEFTHLESKKRFRRSSRRGPRVPILGFFWLYVDNFFIVTSESVELYKVTKSYDLKLLKEYKLAINWFVYSHGNRFLACALGPLSNIIQGFYFEQADTVNRMPRFQIDLPGISSPLSSDQIVICNIYRRLYCLYIDPRQGKIDLFQYNRDKIAFLLSLKTHSASMVYVHVVDNLLVVHNPISYIPMIFDIQDKEPEFPLVAPLPLAPLPATLLFSSNPVSQPVSVPSASEQYRDSWEYLQPRFVLDRKAGTLWQTTLDIEAITTGCSSIVKQVQFLLRRATGKQLLLRIISDMLLQHTAIDVVAETFQIITLPLADTQSHHTLQRQRMKEFSPEPLENILAQEQNNNNNNNNNLNNNNNNRNNTSSAPLLRSSSSSNNLIDGIDSPFGNSSMNSPTVRCPNGLIVIEQQDLYVCFTKFDELQTDHKYVVAVLTEYIKCLYLRRLRPDFYLFELVINCLVRHARYTELHHLLQYHVVCDSVPIACQLLSLDTVYPPAYQLAMDMLKRLCSPEQIIEVLLTRNQFLPALRVLRTNNVSSELIPRHRFLSLCSAFEDPSTFFIVFTFFLQRKEIPDTPEYHQYIQQFTKLFPEYPIPKN